MTIVIQVYLWFFLYPLECENGYGLGCRETCGDCLDSKQCDHINGSCENGCEAGFKGDRCKEGDVLNCFNLFLF